MILDSCDCHPRFARATNLTLVPESTLSHLYLKSKYTIIIAEYERFHEDRTVFFSFIYLKSHPPVSISDSEQCSCKAEEISIHSQ